MPRSSGRGRFWRSETWGSLHAFRRQVAEPIDFRALLIAYLADVRAGVGGGAGNSTTTGCYWGPVRSRPCRRPRARRQCAPEADILPWPRRGAKRARPATEGDS
jgi:hypothetical protein